MLTFFYKAKNAVIRTFRKKLFWENAKSLTGNKRIYIKGKFFIYTKNLSVGDNCEIYNNVIFRGPGEIIIGNNVQIGDNTIIFAAKRVVIGDNTAIAANAYIIDCNHGIALGKNIQEQSLSIAENGINIGSDVWIAAGCTIVKGANIMDGAVIGAMSLVNKEIPKNAIAVGTPAKVLKYRT